MKRYRVYLLAMLLVIITLSIVGCAQDSQTPTTSNLPSIISNAGHEMGSSGYVLAASVFKVISEQTGQTVRCVPVSSDASRIAAARGGTVHTFTTGMIGQFSFSGLFDFAYPEWGPQPIRMFWNEHGRFPMATAKDAGILTPYDLKGKKMYWTPGSAPLCLANTAFLAFGNLTWDDVERIEFSGMSPAHQGMVAGKVDAGLAGFTTPTMYELEKSPRGLWWPEFPHDDEAGWARMTAICPYFVKAIQPAIGAGVTKPLEVMGSPSGWWAYADVDEDIIYWLTKHIHLNFENYKDTIDRATDLRIDLAITPNFMVPFHPGAIKYFKEIGHWTSEFEELQQQLLEQEIALQEAWDETLGEFVESGKKQSEFPLMWMEKRNQIPGIWVPDPEVVKAFYGIK